MKILVNATTLVVGGGIQIGVSFLQNVTGRFERSDIVWLFLVSNEIFLHLSEDLQKDPRIIVFSNRPSHPLKGFKIRRKILEVEEEFKPDLVYSIGFPSYTRFRSKELGRYTNPWEINSEPLPWHLYSRFLDKLKLKLGIFYRQYWAAQADCIETQTQSAALGISKRIRFPRGNIFVIPNSANSVFEYLPKKNLIADINRKYRVFSIAADYPHKNLTIIPKVAHELRVKHGKEVVFFVTLANDCSMLAEIYSEANRLGVSDLIFNAGRLSLTECLEYYNKSDLVFLPTLLEVFSATYLEAMAVGVPIVTTDLDFARDNCGDAALFYSSTSYVDAASKVNEVLSDMNIRDMLIDKGRVKLSEYPTLKAKYDRLYEIFTEIVVNESEHNE